MILNRETFVMLARIAGLEVCTFYDRPAWTYLQVGRIFVNVPAQVEIDEAGKPLLCEDAWVQRPQTMCKKDMKTHRALMKAELSNFQRIFREFYAKKEEQLSFAFLVNARKET